MADRPEPRTRPPDRRERILDAAERLARARGYHGFSYRDVAADVGIRAPSIHHHFPTKAALGEALAVRYTARFMGRLGDAGAPGALAHLVACYRAALAPDDLMCLCGMLGAEIDGLPAEVAAAVGAFFRANVAWAEDALGAADGRAEALVAGLEGALIAARALGAVAVFDRAAGALLRVCRDQERRSRSQ